MTTDETTEYKMILRVGDLRTEGRSETERIVAMNRSVALAEVLHQNGFDAVTVELESLDERVVFYWDSYLHWYSEEREP